MSVYLPVRECRRIFEERYAEQLTFTAEDIAPWLILAGVSDPIRAGAAYTPRRPPNPRQPHNTTGDIVMAEPITVQIVTKRKTLRSRLQRKWKPEIRREFDGYWADDLGPFATKQAAHTEAWYAAGCPS